MVKNPACLLNLFQTCEIGTSWREEISPVSQNIIFLNPVCRKPNHIDFSTLHSGGKISLGRRVIDFRFRNEPKRGKIANTAVSITQDGEITVVFASGPARAEEYASTISELLPEIDDASLGIQNLIEYIREHIHEEYPLIEYLKKGVAYHYGKMPPLVRSSIEDLVCSQEIKYICCTSTLLQGVNLPARNIVIENPKSGTGNPMTRADFLNLSGRAGRLTHEFQGDVWCINPESWDDPENGPCYEGESFQTIEPAFVTALKNGGELVEAVLHDEIDSPTNKEHSLGVAVLNHILHGGDETRDISKFAENEEAMEKLLQTQLQIKNLEIHLPTDLLKRHRGISPLRLQDLYKFMAEKVSLDDWIPLHPRERGAYDRMKAIFNQVSIHLGHINNGSYEFHTVVANQWIFGIPLKQMIKGQISHLKKKGDFEGVGRSVLGMLEVLEDCIRFRYVKYTRAYCDILSLLLESTGMENKNIPPLHLYLECGSADACTLALISLGLSRSTAICIADYINVSDEDATAKFCHEKLKQLDLDELDLPQICKDEIRHFT